MSHSVTLNFNVNVNQQISESSLPQDEQHAIQGAIDRVTNHEHNSVDGLISKVSHDLLGKHEWFVIKARNLSKRVIKHLLTQAFPDMALKIVKILPKVFAIGLAAL